MTGERVRQFYGDQAMKTVFPTFAALLPASRIISPVRHPDEGAINPVTLTAASAATASLAPGSRIRVNRVETRCARAANFAISSMGSPSETN